MQTTYDLLIRNATIVDGTEAIRYTADIGINGDRIVKICDLSSSSGKTEIDLGGQVAAPGFIDAHTHDDRLMLSNPEMTPKVSQGVTTIIGGNCGVSLAPMPRPIPDPVTPPLNLLDDEGKWFKFGTFKAYLDALRAQPSTTNRAMLVGHTTLRVATMDDLEQPANAEQIAAMRELVDEAMQAGAIGVSTGLFSEPAVAAPTEEVIEICRPLKKYNGLYCTHMRDEADGVDFRPPVDAHPHARTGLFEGFDWLDICHLHGHPNTVFHINRAFAIEDTSSVSAFANCRHLHLPYVG
jgi:N-acyl-D-amino-acid deacylase